MKFTSLYAMESAFLLLDVDGILWFWTNTESKPLKADFSWNGKHKITAIGCNLLRASVLFRSKHCATFYDKCFTCKFSCLFVSFLRNLQNDIKM